MKPVSKTRPGGVVVGALIAGAVLLGAPTARAETQTTPSTSPKVSIATGRVTRTAPQRSAQWESRRLSTTE